MIRLALPEATEEQLHDLAQQQGVSTETYVTQLLETHAQQRDLKRSTESQLLQQVGLGFSEVQWQRYEALVELRREERLGDAEQTELIALSNQLEAANAKRMAVLAELSKRREVTLGQLMNDLGLAKPTVRA